MSERRWVLVAATAAVAAAACGSRVGYIGERPDGDGDVDADVDVDADSDSDADTDSDADGAPGCEVPDELVVIFSETAPGFVHSMVRLPVGHLVLAASYGWSPDDELYLWLLDGRTLALIARQAVPFETMSLAYDTRTGGLVAVAEEDGEAFLVRYDIGAEWAFVEMQRRSFCVECAASRSHPVPGPSVAAVAAEWFGEEAASIFIVPYDEGDPVESVTAIPASDPAVVGNSFGPVFLYLSEGRLVAQGMHWNGDPVGSSTWVAGPNVTGYEAASHGSSFLVAAAVDEGAGPLLGLHELDGSLWVTRSVTMPDDPELVYELSMSESQGTVAIAWGEMLGAERVGIHLSAYDSEELGEVLSPSLITPPRPDPVSSYGLRPVIAPHDEGHAVAWGGWHEVSNYGIYGMVVRCWAY